MIMMLRATLFAVMPAWFLSPTGMQVYAEEILNNNSGTWNKDSTIDNDVTINGGVTVNDNIILTIPAGKKLTVNGGINATGKTLTVEGKGKLIVWGSDGSNGRSGHPDEADDEDGNVIVGGSDGNDGLATVTGGNGGQAGVCDIGGSDGSNVQAVSGTITASDYKTTIKESDDNSNWHAINSGTISYKQYVKVETTGGPTITKSVRGGVTEKKKSSVPLLAKMTAKGKNSLKLSWTRIKGAKGYDIFLNRCSRSKKQTIMKQTQTVKAGAPRIWVRKGLREHTAYKACVKAYVITNGKKRYIKTSPVVHAFTSGYRGDIPIQRT